MCWGPFWINFIKKILQHGCFPVKFLKTPVLKNICKRLLLLSACQILINNSIVLPVKSWKKWQALFDGYWNWKSKISFCAWFPWCYTSKIIYWNMKRQYSCQNISNCRFFTVNYVAATKKHPNRTGFSNVNFWAYSLQT